MTLSVRLPWVSVALLMTELLLTELSVTECSRTSAAEATPQRGKIGAAFSSGRATRSSAPALKHSAGEYPVCEPVRSAPRVMTETTSNVIVRRLPLIEATESDAGCDFFTRGAQADEFEGSEQEVAGQQETGQPESCDGDNKCNAARTRIVLDSRQTRNEQEALEERIVLDVQAAHQHSFTQAVTLTIPQNAAPMQACELKTRTCDGDDQADCDEAPLGHENRVGFAVATEVVGQAEPVVHPSGMADETASELADETGNEAGGEEVDDTPIATHDEATGRSSSGSFRDSILIPPMVPGPRLRSVSQVSHAVVAEMRDGQITEITAAEESTIEVEEIETPNVAAASEESQSPDENLDENIAENLGEITDAGDEESSESHETVRPRTQRQSIAGLRGTIRHINSRQQTMSLEFPRGQAPALGTQFKVYHQYFKHRAYAGEVEVIDVDRELITARMIGPWNGPKVTKGDEVVGR